MSKKLKSLVWLTDIHLNFLSVKKRVEFYSTLEDSGDWILITGDIGESHDWETCLNNIHYATDIPIYFVLGNHDYYGSSIKKVRRLAVTYNGPHIMWLGQGVKSPIQYLSEDTVLCGVDTWADARNGNFDAGRVRLNDSVLISELREAYLQGLQKLKSVMQYWADKDTRNLKKQLLRALKDSKVKKIIVATHVPLYAQATIYKGKVSDENFQPYFSSKKTGEMVLEVAAKHLHVQFLLLSGHSHGQAVEQVSSNVLVRVAEAEYFDPCVADRILI